MNVTVAAEPGRWRRSSRVALAAGALIAAACIAYWPAIKGEFVFDDLPLVAHNPTLEGDGALRRIWFTADNYEWLPITYTVFFFERLAWGDWTAGYHLVSIVLHAMNAVLLWRLLHQLKVPGAWLAALLFAVHPVAASSVAFVAEQKNLWAVLFCLISLMCYLRFDASAQYRWYAASLAAFFAALLSKTSIVFAPAIVLMFTWWRNGRLRRRDFALTAPLFLLSLATGAATVWFQINRGINDTPVDIGNGFERFKLAGYALWFYVGKAIVPVHLSFIYPRWDYLQLSVWPAVAAIGVAAILWRYRASWGRAPLIAYGSYVAMLLPILGFIGMSYMKFSFVADYFQYPALPVAMVVVGSGCVWIGRRAPNRIRYATTPAAAVAALFLGVLTWRQAEVYKNAVTLWSETVRQNPGSAIAENNLARAFNDRNDPSAALPHFAAAARLEPENPTWRCHYGQALLAHGDPAQAAAELAESVRLNPDDGSARIDLAMAFNRLGQFTAAREQAEAAVRLSPQSAEAHSMLANSLAGLGEWEQAVDEFKSAARLAPESADLKLQWAKALTRLNHAAEAAKVARDAVNLDPQQSQARDTLAEALLLSGQWDQALEQFLEAVKLNPNDASAHSNLAFVFNRRRRPLDAASHAQAAIRLDPTMPEAHFNLGVAYLLESEASDAEREFREAIRLRPGYVDAEDALQIAIRNQAK